MGWKIKGHNPGTFEESATHLLPSCLVGQMGLITEVTVVYGDTAEN